MNKLGSNAIGVRRYNERLILTTVRRLGGLSKADLSRMTGLSPQAVVRIVDSLADEGRLVQAGKRTGGLGQPSVIYRINAKSGCTIGVEIGRDRLICTMVDFVGRVIASDSRTSDFPSPQSVAERIRAFARLHLAQLDEEQRSGFMGYGIAMPWFINEWQEEAGTTEAEVSAWASPEIEDFFHKELEGPVLFENDGNAGALAELMNGSGKGLTNFLYIHIGNFVGGGLILNGEIQRGKHGNAGALASMPIPGRKGFDYLLHAASLYSMNQDLCSGSFNESSWIKHCATALAFAIISANSLLDLDAVIIGGGLSNDRLRSILKIISEVFEENSPRDFFEPAIMAGANGEMAPAIGAGLLPLVSTYSANLVSLLKISD